MPLAGERNVTGPLKEREWLAAQDRADARMRLQSRTGLSPALAKTLEFAADPKEFKAALLREYPEPGAQIEVCLRILGPSNGYNTIDTAELQIGSYDVKTLEVELEKALLGTDRQVRRGAVHLWWREGWPINWTPPKSLRLHQIIVRSEQEDRYYPVRMRALDHLAEWKDEFSADAFTQRLATALHDPTPQVRRKAMLIVGQAGNPSSIPLLMQILNGEVVESLPLPDVPESEMVDLPPTDEEVAPGYSDAELAAIALADLQHVAAKPLIAAKQPLTPMLEVALALFGDGSRLKPEHFSDDYKDRQLQQAAVRAVIRAKGRFGLELAIKCDGNLLARELCQMLRTENAPGSQELVEDPYWNTMQRWFKEHGAEYLKRFDK